VEWAARLHLHLSEQSRHRAASLSTRPAPQALQGTAPSSIFIASNEHSLNIHIYDFEAHHHNWLSLPRTVRGNTSTTKRESLRRGRIETSAVQCTWPGAEKCVKTNNLLYLVASMQPWTRMLTISRTAVFVYQLSQPLSDLLRLLIAHTVRLMYSASCKLTGVPCALLETVRSHSVTWLPSLSCDWRSLKCTVFQPGSVLDLSIAFDTFEHALILTLLNVPDCK